MLRSLSYGFWFSSALLSLFAAAATACSSDDAQNSANAAGTGNNAGVSSAAGAAGGDFAGGAGLGGSSGNAGQSSISGGEAGASGGGQAGNGGAGQVELDPEDTSNRSGSRLQWKGLSASDGASFGGEWFDTQLNETCTFETAADGMLRCLPRAKRLDEDYSDAACENLAVRLLEGECSIQFAQRTTPDGCSTKREIFKLGSEIRPGKMYRGASCEEYSPSLSNRVFSIGAAIPASEFVAATVTKVETKTRLQPRFLVASDGAVQFLGWYDSERKEDCQFSIAADGELRCLPEHPIMLPDMHGEYSDGGCTKRAAILSECRKNTRIYFTMQQQDACAPGLRIFAKGEDVTVIRFRDPFMGCQPIGDGQPGVSIGAEVLPSEFAKGEITIEPGSERIRQRIATTDDGAKQVVGLYDSKLEADCDFRVAEDGKHRCVPARAVSRSNLHALYADSACTQPVYMNTCDSQFAFAVDATACPAKWIYYQTTPLDVTLFEKFGRDCFPTDTPPFLPVFKQATAAATFAASAE